VKRIIKQNRQKFIMDNAQTERFWYFSGTTLSLHRVLIPVINKYVKKTVLDAGCGNQPLRKLIEGLADKYDSLDIEKRVNDVTFLGDIQDLSQIVNNNTYDSVICLEVLEHVPEPQKAVCEIYRILKKSGYAICSVPHLSGLHEEPHDFYRFTRHGLSYVFNKAGFQQVKVIKVGGLISFLNHLFSLIFIGITYSLPIIKNLALQSNQLIAGLVVRLDELLDKKGVFANGYVVIAKK